MMGGLKKLLVLLGVIALFLALALVVGDGQMHATAVGWVPVGMVVICVLVDLLFSRWAKSALEFVFVTQVFDCQRGESALLEATIRNRSPLVIQEVSIKVGILDGPADAQDMHVVLSLGPFSTRTLSIPLTFPHAGIFRVGMRSAAVGDFIGLFQSRIPMDASVTVCVVPRVVSVAQLSLQEEAMLESQKATKSVLADSLDYAYVRDYVMGDPLKSIHWKLSARVGKYFTRLYEMNTNPGLVVVLDLFMPDAPWEEQRTLLDAVVESALSIMNWAQSHGVDVELRFADRLGQTVKLDRCNDETTLTLLDDLPAANAAGPARSQVIAVIQEMLSQGSGQNNMVVCSANVGEDMVGALLSAKMGRRAPVLLAAVPDRLVDRAREEYCRHLNALDDQGIMRLSLSSSAELTKVML